MLITKPGTLTYAPRPIASWSHTAWLVIIFLVLAVLGVLFTHGQHSTPLPGQHQSPLPFYLSAIASEWLLFRGAKAGLHRADGSWRDLIGRTGFTSKDLLSDVALALGSLTLWRGNLRAAIGTHIRVRLRATKLLIGV